jgi:hypothetical protein
MGILISNLSSTTNIANSDSLILDQSDKTVKITLDELSTHFSLTELQADVELDDLAAISNYTVIGNVSGASAKPSEVAILNQNSLASNSSTALATQSSIRYYVDGHVSTLQSQINNLIGGGGTSSLYDVWPDSLNTDSPPIGGPLVDAAGNRGYLLTQGTLVDYIDTKVTGILPAQLSTGAPVWDSAGYVTLGAEGVNNDHLVTKGYVDSVVPSGAVGGSSVLRYGEINAGDISTASATNDPTPTTSGDFTTARSQVGVGSTVEGENYFTCTFNTPLPNANYNVIIELFSNSSATYDTDNEVNTVITAKSANGFQFNAENGQFMRSSNLLPTDVSFNVRIESNSAAAVTTSQAWSVVSPTYVNTTDYTNNTGSPLVIRGYAQRGVVGGVDIDIIIDGLQIQFLHFYNTSSNDDVSEITIPAGSTYSFLGLASASTYYFYKMTTTAVTGSVINGADGPQGIQGIQGEQGPAAATYTLNGTILTITTP